MDNKQMIHMACEGILIGGLSLYFSKQLKQQNKEIEELKAIISKNQAANEKRFEVVFNFLDSVNGGFMPPQQQQREAPREDRVISQQKVNPAVAAQQKRQPREAPREVKKSPVKEEEIKRLPQKKKSVVQTVEEPSVLTIITKKNVEASKENMEVCDPNDEDCVDDIQDEMGTLLEGMEESLEEDMDE
jgi:hypothetical protein